MSKVQKQSRIELLVESIAVEKQLIDEVCDDLITARDSANKKGAKEASKKLEPHIKRYNLLIDEYNKYTGEKVATVSKNLAGEIMAGSSYHGIANVGQAGGTVSASSYNANIAVHDKKELAQYLAKSDKALANVRTRLETTLSQKNEANGYNRVLLIINCLTYQRYIIERLAENLHVCVTLADDKKIKSIKKLLATEIENYNKFVNEYTAITGSKLTYASENIPNDIIEGKPYTQIPAINYTTHDGVNRNSDAEVAAVAVAAAAAVDKANKKAKKAKKNKEHVQKTALEEKIAEQANKDLAVLTKAADFEISLLESKKDMTGYRFGQTNADMKKTKKEIGKKIKGVQKNHKAALKFETADNERYYEVITNDPATMEVKKRRADRTKIASIRTQMMTLLNKRDELNSKLLSIYNGTEVNLDGTSINQQWRNIKSNEAEKSIKKNKSVAKKISRLPASNGEKQKLYKLLNDNVDAASTLALSKYRLKKKEYVSKADKKALKKDIKNMEQTIKQNNKDINWVVKKVKKRDRFF